MAKGMVVKSTDCLPSLTRSSSQSQEDLPYRPVQKRERERDKQKRRTNAWVVIAGCMRSRSSSEGQLHRVSCQTPPFPPSDAYTPPSTFCIQCTR